MFVRVLLAIAFLGVLLPFMVFLRPAHTSPACDWTFKAFYLIAQQRDNGTPAQALVNRFRAKYEAEEIPAETYAVLVEWIVLVYSSDLSPDELAEVAKSACLKATGAFEA